MFDCRKDNNKEDESKQKPIPFFSLFRYSTFVDKLLMTIGTIAAIFLGAGFPLMTIFYGEMLDTFVDYTNARAKYYALNNSESNFTNFNQSMLDSATDTFKSEINKFGLGLVITGLYFILFCYITVSTFSLSANNQAHRIRLRFFKSALKQDMEWFDVEDSKDFAVKMTTDLTRIQEAIGDKVGLCIYSVSCTVIAVITAFIYGWKLTLVAFATMPVVAVAFSIISKETEAYGKAGSVAEEVLSAIRTVVAFGGESKELRRFSNNLTAVKKSGIKRNMYTGIGSGVMWFFTYASYALTFWYGVKLIINEPGTYTGREMTVVFFN
ncbi:multidrug resistance protein 1A-like protein, partial [Leptotrombidium deliense]